MTVTAAEVTTLIDRLNEKQREAHSLIADLYQTACEVAQHRLDQLDADSRTDRRAEELLAMVNDAVAKPNKTQEAISGGVMGQHTMLLTASPDVGAQQARSGLFVTSTALRYTDSLSREQRAKVLHAIVLATRGQLDTGLIQFTADDLKALTADALEKWCQALAPDAYASWKASQADTAKERSLCAQQLKALRQAAPKLYTVKADASIEIVLKATGGNTTIAGITIKGDAFGSGNDGINRLTPDQFEAVRMTAAYQAHLASGRYKIIDEGELVEVVA